jgi:hypothetical protein
MENLRQEPDQDLLASAYWSKEFGISQEEMEKALKAGKSSTEVIEEYVRSLNLELVS